jgi:hypothetical protein
LEKKVFHSLSRPFFMPSYQCVFLALKKSSILSICEEEMKILAISETREYEEKKDQSRVARSMILKRRTLQ